MRDYKKVKEIVVELLLVNNEVMKKYEDFSNEMESALSLYSMTAVQQLPVTDIPDENIDEHFALMARIAKSECEAMVLEVKGKDYAI